MTVAGIGGRPRLQTLSQLRQHSSLEVKNNNGGYSRLPNGLRELKEMMKLRNITMGEARGN